MHRTFVGLSVNIAIYYVVNTYVLVNLVTNDEITERWK